MKSQLTVSSFYLFLFPCLICSSGTTLQDIQLQLTQEDAAEAAKGVVSLHAINVTVFLTKGLELEDQQYVFLY